ncbi:MAG: 2-hydroxyacid dehydrogenase [Pseudomonadota bacterium]
MRIAVFNTKDYDRRFLEAANRDAGHSLTFFEPRLDRSTAILAQGHDAICIFVNDDASAEVLEALKPLGISAVALRCAGYNNVDLRAAERLGIDVVRVPAYSPEAVAEFTVALLLALERRIPRAWSRVRDHNFALDGLIGRNVAGRTVGVIGTGRIGALVARAFRAGFGCRVLASDLVEDRALVALGVDYVPRDLLIAQADIITLHCPLTPETHHLIDAASLKTAKQGVVIVNTSRGGLIDTDALIAGLKRGRIAGVALDVYEQEADLFFEDLSGEIVQDDVFQRLLTFPNVLVTGHQAFLTEEALTAIAETTLRNVSDLEAGGAVPNRVTTSVLV